MLDLELGSQALNSEFVLTERILQLTLSIGPRHQFRVYYYYDNHFIYTFGPFVSFDNVVKITLSSSWL